MLTLKTHTWYLLQLIVLILNIQKNYANDVYSTSYDHYAYFKNLNTEDGLSSDIIYDIIQDSTGIMWFATDNGLTSFDGSRFNIYRHNPEDSLSLSDNTVTSLTIDIDNNLWVGTSIGLNIFDRKNNSFIRYYSEKGNDNSIANNFIKALYADKEGYLWIEAAGGVLSRLDIKENVYNHLMHMSGSHEGPFHFHHIFEDSGNNLWIGGKTLDVHQLVNKDIERLEGPYRSTDKIAFFEGGCFFETKELGVVYGSNLGRLAILNPVTKQFNTVLNLEMDPTCAVCDDNDHAWIGGNPLGIYRIDFQNKNIIKYQHNELNENSLISSNIYSIYKDRDHNIWIGTNKGVSLYSFKLNLIRQYKSYPNIESSLTSNDITAVMQDRDGLVWAGTKRNGVDTFSLDMEKAGNLTYKLLRSDLDRNTFEREKYVLKQYFIHETIEATEKQDKDFFNQYSLYRNTSLKFKPYNEDAVSALYQDKNGIIYIGLWGHVGFNTYDKKNKLFKRYALWSKRPDIDYPSLFTGNLFGANWYTGFLEDNKSRLWCTTWEAVGLNLFDREKGMFSPKHYMPGNYPRVTAESFSYDSKRNRMWLGGGFYGYYDFNEKQYYRYIELLPEDYPNRDILNGYFEYSKAKQAPLPVNFKCGQIIYDQENTVWILANDGITKHTVSPEKIEIVHRTGELNYANSIALSIDRKYLWINRKNGIERLSVSDNKVIRIPEIYNHIQSEMKAIYSDHKGRLWIGANNGIYIYNMEKGISRIDLDDKGEGRGKQDLLVSAITGDKFGRIFVGCAKGLYILKEDKIEIVYPFSASDTKGLPGFVIKHIEVDNEKQELWLSTNQGLAHIDLLPERVTVYQHDPLNKDGILGNNVFSTGKDGSGNIWVSTLDEIFYGFCLFDRDKNRFVNLSEPGDDELTSRLATCIIQDYKNNIWVGTEKGLNKLNIDTDKIKHYYHYAWDETGLSDDKINCLFPDQKGFIWVGTDKGLNKYIPDEDLFRQIHELTNLRVMGIQEDLYTNIWVSTNNGIYCLDKDDKILGCFYDFHGFSTNSFSEAICRLYNGDIAIGSENGLNIFNPKKLLEICKVNPVVFTNFMVRDSTFYADFNKAKRIELRHNQNYFSIDFSSVDYEFGKHLKYRFKLEDFDNDWSYVDANMLTAKYMNVPPGSYLFKAEVSDNFGRWTDGVNSILIIIQKPWYRQLWFILVSIVLILCSLYLIFKLRIKSLEKEKIVLKKKVDDRTRELMLANEKLTESEKHLQEMIHTKDLFFSIIAHDLKNPVTALDRTLYQICENHDHFSDNERKTMLLSVYGTTNHTVKLLKDLLLWSHIQKEMIVSTPKWLKLSETVNSVIELVQLTAEKKGIHISNEVDPGLSVYIDEYILTTILRNLISNAIHYSFMNSIVKIVTTEKPGHIDVSVVDYGTGIKDKDISGLFRHDVKIRRKGTENEIGSGLGLIITRELIEKINEQIRVKSELGKGSVFTFTIRK